MFYHFPFKKHYKFIFQFSFWKISKKEFKEKSVSIVSLNIIFLLNGCKGEVFFSLLVFLLKNITKRVLMWVFPHLIVFYKIQRLNVAHAKMSHGPKCRARPSFVRSVIPIIPKISSIQFSVITIKTPAAIIPIKFPAIPNSTKKYLKIL